MYMKSKIERFQANFSTLFRYRFYITMRILFYSQFASKFFCIFLTVKTKPDDTDRHVV